MIVALLYAALYLLGVWRYRGRWPVTRTAWFACGVACTAAALSLDDRRLPVHMVQHLALLLVAPLLLLAGRPGVLVLRALAPEWRRRLLRIAPAPAVCLGGFTFVVLLTHLPVLYGACARDPLLHSGEHGLYVLAGLLLWWPMFDGARLGGLGRLAYVLVAMVPMSLLGAYLVREPVVIYAGVGAVADQQQAGAIMWVLGDVIMVAVGLWCALAGLVAEERRQRAREGTLR
jgi:putative copper resistance protein D